MKKYFNVKKTILSLFLLYSYHIAEPSKRTDLTGKRVAYLHQKSLDIFQKKSTDVQLLLLIKSSIFIKNNNVNLTVPYYFFKPLILPNKTVIARRHDEAICPILAGCFVPRNDNC